MARILIAAQGSLGDVLPLAVIGRRLLDRGHEVRFLAPDAMRAEAESRGLAFLPLGGNDPRTVQREIVASAPRGYWAGVLHNLRRLIRAPMVPQFEQVLRLRAHVADADAVLLSHMIAAVTHLAEAEGVPFAVFHPTPTLPAKEYPNPVGPLWWHLLPKPGLLNRATHAVWHRLIWRVTGEWTNELRRRLGLPPARRPFALVPRLVAASPALFPLPASWPAQWRLTGFAREGDAPPEPLPPELERFLDAGEPPVYVGFSSTPIADAGFWSDVVLAAVRQVGCRVVLGAGWSTLPEALEASDRVAVVGHVSHRALFPRMAAAVHACGAGTLAEAMLAGIPSVAVPVMGEQRFIAAQMYRRGLTPRPRELAKLDAAALAARIRAVLTEPRWRARTRELGDQMRSEDGAGRAARMVEELLAAGPGARAAAVAAPPVPPPTLTAS